MEPLPLLNAADAARLLGVSTWRMLDLARQRIVPSVRLGRSVRFDRRQLESWVAAGGRSLDERREAREQSA